jgi:transposase
MGRNAGGDNFLSVSQFAAREGVSRARVLQLLAAQRIGGARRTGHQWVIPASAAIDRRPPGRPRKRRPEGAQRFLRRMARKYVWWLPPAQALERPHLVASQIMNLGDYGDVRALEAVLDRERLAEVLRAAEPGRFSPRSWSYWHHRLGLAPQKRVPRLRQRTLV